MKHKVYGIFLILIISLCCLTGIITYGIMKKKLDTNIKNCESKIDWTFGGDTIFIADNKVEPTLNVFYAKINKEYFSNQLPKDVTITYSDSVLLYNSYGVTDNEFKTIKLSRKLKGNLRLAEMTLLHEIVHLKIDGHGLLFQQEMLRLAKEGAMWGVW